MKAYIGAKIISAEPMLRSVFEEKWGKGRADIAVRDQEGYHVVYPPVKPGDDFYHSWSPAEVFEVAYREILYNERELLFPAPDMSPHEQDAPVEPPHANTRVKT